MKSRRTLIGCYEIPGYGGANTASYQLFRIMQEEGFDVHYINLIDEQDVVYFAFAFGANYGNPLSLENVYNCALNGVLYGPHPELTALIEEIAPDVIIGVDFIAALLMKRAAPKTTLIFLTAGCQQVKDAVTGRHVTDLVTQEKMIAGASGFPRRSCREEVEAADMCDLIVTHSNVTLALFHHFFPYLHGKIYPKPIWFGEWIYREAQKYGDLAKPFAQRAVDVLFLASSWARPEKNYSWVKKLLSALPDATIHVIGEVEERKKLSPVHYHGLVTERYRLFELMGRAKTVASPSLYDSAPGILFEAAAMGCNIVASKNCGNWMICNEQLLAEPFSPKNFVNAIRLSLFKKFDDSMTFFLETNSYGRLVEMTQLI
jgi:glycosyltransferase involved in cell wall biosynthesis